MSTTPHPVAPEEIMAHLDAELSPVRAQLVSAHLESCAHCQELLISLHNTSQSLSNWTVAPATVGAKFADQLSADAVNASSRLRDSSGRKIQLFPSQRWKLLTGSAVLAVLLIMIIGTREARYDFSAPKARLAVAKRAQEQEAIVERLSEEKDLAPVDKWVGQEKGLASPTDRFRRADASKSNKKSPAFAAKSSRWKPNKKTLNTASTLPPST
jgi:anti-sigma factor RsiW